MLEVIIINTKETKTISVEITYIEGCFHQSLMKMK